MYSQSLQTDTIYTSTLDNTRDKHDKSRLHGNPVYTTDFRILQMNKSHHIRYKRQLKTLPLNLVRLGLGLSIIITY